MTSTHGRGLLHLAAAVDQQASLEGDLADLTDLYVESARLAERGGLDFVTLGGSFARSGPDAFGVLARVAPATARIGLVPTVTTTHRALPRPGGGGDPRPGQRRPGRLAARRVAGGR